MKRKLFAVVLAIVLGAMSSLALAEEIWIDVRSTAEHMLDHIDGDPRIDHEDIVDNVTKLFPDRDSEIILYCRSGGRAGKAMTALQQAGFTNVSNAGGIEDARRARGLLD